MIPQSHELQFYLLLIDENNFKTKAGSFMLAFPRVEEYQFCAYFILPELISLAMPFKIVLPQYMEHMNSNEVQKGKNTNYIFKKEF